MEDMKLIEYKPVHATPKTLKQYLAEKKARKIRVAARIKIRQKIASLTKDLREGDIPFKSPNVLYKRHYNKIKWSGYYSYLLTVAREAVA